ncbi:VOC family protein [Paraflavitalea soli]|uniref:VOC family protein n=1 Tax=Paraflavitalea soli TaxID=2315862 RepID=A0A3B7MJ09_9BACT|nr:VOC family protein [Paraflavitalea soli]AXY73577.1 VOC family protein [Paraflavitalea soli]
MITRFTHFSLWVLDQDSAYDFYVNKLGFKVVTDVPMVPANKGNRWLTVRPPQMEGIEINLSLITEGMWYSKETAETLRELVRKGTFGCGVLTCDDIYATYEELKAKGVRFTKAPAKEFYGTEAFFKDDSGNWFSLAQLNP